VIALKYAQVCIFCQLYICISLVHQLLRLLNSTLFGVPFLAIHSTFILDDFGSSLTVRTIWCFTDSLGHTHTKIHTATFAILALVQHEKEGIRLALTLGTIQHILDYLVGSLYIIYDYCV
jgi:hypothetical protein